MVAWYYEAIYIMIDQGAMEYKPDHQNENFRIPHILIWIKSQTKIFYYEYIIFQTFAVHEFYKTIYIMY
jgi:hypothetical protein